MEALQPISNDSFSYSWLINTKPSPFDALHDAVRLSFDAAEDDPFIEIDPWWVASLRRASVDGAHDFDFGLSGSQSPVLAHADQIFSNGLILPLHLVTPPRLQQQEAEEASRSSDSSESALSRSLSLDSSRVLLSLSNRYKSPHFYTDSSRPISLNCSSTLRFRSAQGRPLPLDPSAKKALSRMSGGPKLPFLRSCGRTSKRILQKYLCFLMPLYKKVKELKLVWRAEGSSAVVPSVSRSCVASLDASPRMGIDALPGVDYCRFTRVLDTGVEKSIHDAVLHCKRSIGESRLVSFASDEQQTYSVVSK